MRNVTSGLTSTAIKTIALLLMVIDHVYYFFNFTGVVPTWYNMLGRLSAPLFLFCTVEGFAHTHNRRRYFLRLWTIAAGMGSLSALMAFDGILRRPDGLFPTNGIFSNFVILCSIWQGIDWMRQGKRLAGTCAIAGPWIWGLLVFLLSMIPGVSKPILYLGCSLLPAWTCIIDGGFVYIVGGTLLYLFRDKRKIQLISWALWIFCTEFLAVWLGYGAVSGVPLMQMFTRNYQWFSIAAVAVMALYNGRRGASGKQLFYWFYPLHIYALYALSWALLIILR